MRSGFQSTLVLIGGRMTAFLVGFFTPVVLARVFDQAAFGTYKQIFLIYGTIQGVAQLGMAESLFYFIPTDQARAGRYAFNSVVVLAGAGAAFLAALWMGRLHIAGWLRNQAVAPLVPAIGLYLLVMLVTALLEIVMISRRRHTWAAGSYALSDMLRAVLLILAAAVFGDLRWVMAAIVVFGLARLAATLVYLRREFGGEFRPDAGLLRRQLAYALPFELAVLVEVAQANYHSWAVSYHFSAAVFAIYAVGCLQLPFVDFVATPASNVMMVRMAEELRAGRRHLAAFIWRDTTRKLALIFIPIFVFLFISARDIILLLFTSRYAESVPIFTLWCTVILLAVIQTDGLLRVYAQTRFLLLMNVVRLGVVAVLINWAISSFHLLGAVLVTVLGTAVAKVLALERARTLMQVGVGGILPWRSLATTLGVGCAAAVPALLVKRFVALPNLPLLALVGTAYMLSYAGLLLWFDLLSAGEKRFIADGLRRLLPRAVKAGEAEGA
ncbi:MAG: oligosaccharide flippase family protein [Acidobacteria bacterium]|nr:oligosaccharide flippase family protein [Acidobacteriota bacterium]